MSSAGFASSVGSAVYHRERTKCLYQPSATLLSKKAHHPHQEMNLDISNVKTVKEQTFHKCFTMFHKRSDHLTGMKPKCLSLFLNLPHRKRSFLFGPGEHILDQIETICYQQDKFGNDTKTFWFRFQMDIGMFVLSFLTLLTWTLLLPLA